MSGVTRPGSFCWFELATTEQAAAKTFYESLFGWTGADMPIGPSVGLPTVAHA
jgi:predicted enzyme related to lactoylglutathione lyase